MTRVCPRCRGVTEHHLCPRCGVRTDDLEPAAPAGAGAVPLAPTPGISPALGLLVGLLLAQGLYYALWHLGSAYLIATGGPEAEKVFWEGPHGVIAQQAILAVALLFAGMIAGAGQRSGAALGAILGIANAVLLVVMQMALRQASDELVRYGQPVIHAVVGALGGLIGSRVWRPAPALPILAGPEVSQEMLSTRSAVADQPVVVEAEPYPWSRIVIGAVLAAAGTLGAHLIRDLVVMASGGSGHEMRQSQFIPWQIAVVAQVLGGAVAGANTRHGGAYGFWVGVLAAAGVVLGESSGRLHAQAGDFLVWFLGFGAAGGPTALVLLGTQTLLLAVVGGWLGGLVMPVIPPKRALSAGDR